MSYIPGYDSLPYYNPMRGEATRGLATPLMWANRAVKPGQTGTTNNDVRTDDIISPWLGVRPHFQLYSTMTPGGLISVVDVPNMATG